MGPKEIAQSLEAVVRMRRPSFLWGSPGIGKSAVVRQVAAKMDLELVDVRISLLDPVDLRGLPKVANGHTEWAPPIFLPRKGKGILFLDEMNAAGQMVQNACYQLCLDMKIGEYELPAGWTVLAAGNRESDRSGVVRMPTALRNRFIHLDFAVDLEQWIAWAVENGIRPEIMAFLRFRPELLHDFNKDANAFASPRSWQFVSEILDAGGGHFGPLFGEKIQHGLIEGAVGEGACAEIVGFLRVFNSLPDISDIFKDPDCDEIPQDPATLYALCGCLSKSVDSGKMEKLTEYLKRLPQEFSIVCIRDAVRHDPAIQSTAAFIEWAANHSNVAI